MLPLLSEQVAVLEMLLLMRRMSPFHSPTEGYTAAAAAVALEGLLQRVEETSRRMDDPMDWEKLLAPTAPGAQQQQQDGASPRMAAALQPPPPPTCRRRGRLRPPSRRARQRPGRRRLHHLLLLHYCPHTSPLPCCQRLLGPEVGPDPSRRRVDVATASLCRRRRRSPSYCCPMTPATRRCPYWPGSADGGRSGPSGAFCSLASLFFFLVLTQSPPHSIDTR